MTPKIVILPEHVANHIAAGEVIERPASVVKELVENALDAEATQIDLDIGVGGKAYIRIHDNGCGMSREDAQLAFERHATSKIRATEDLTTIMTFGFRGEALPSIASVSKLKLVTQTPDAPVGTRIEIQGGKLLNVIDSGASRGTLIEVNDLFYNTPARLKFLKSPAAELSYINAVIVEEALAYPYAGFSVKNNGKEQLNVPANSDLLQRIAGLFGRELIRELVEVRESAGSIELRGYIGLPSCHRANRNYQKIFINQRPVKDKVLSHAILQAYETLLPKRRYPVVFLFLAMPPQLVDVNVHPAKAEVRFINSQAIHDLVVKGIRKTLSAGLNIASLPAFKPTPIDEDALSEFPAMQSEIPLVPGENTSQTQSISAAFPPPFEREFSGNTDPLRRASIGTSDRKHLPSFSPTHGAFSRPAGSHVFSRMKPIGQFYDTYLLAQDGDELVIVDQHAAHERICYDKLKRQLRETTPDIQPLLFPISIELSHREQAILDEHLEDLEQYGLEIEHFGGMTYLLKAVPALLINADYKKLVYDMIDQLTDTEKTTSVEQQFEKILTVMACHSAIRAHQPLHDVQITAMLRQLDAVELPYTCPHGRPTVITISLHDLEKKFGRE